MIDGLRWLREMPPRQRLLRLVVLIGPVAALLALGPSGHWPDGWVVAVVLLVSAASAVAPDSPAALVADLLVVGWWLLRAHHDVPVTTLVGGGALAASHVAAVLTSYGPVRLVPGPALVRLWVVRWVWLLVPAVVVLVLARLLDGTARVSLLWPAALVVVAALALAVSGALRPRD